MAITYYMVQIPPYLLFICFVVFGALFAGICTHYFRRFATVRIMRAHNEVTGFIFLAIASFYALLQSFVVLAVWGQLNDTRANASFEGSSATGFYRDIKNYPDSVASRRLLAAYLDYVYYVIDEEFPNMAIMKPSRRTPEALNRVFRELVSLQPKNAFQAQIITEMFSHLNELDRYRGLRTMSIDTEIPAPIWIPIILGALITLAFGILLDIENHKMHVILNSLLGVFIMMFMFIIILLDHPYTGHIGIKPKAYRTIFTLEKWANEDHHIEKQQQKNDTIYDSSLMHAPTPALKK